MSGLNSGTFSGETAQSVVAVNPLRNDTFDVSFFTSHAATPSGTNAANDPASVNLSPIPEPSAWPMISLGFLLLMAQRRYFGTVK